MDGQTFQSGNGPSQNQIWVPRLVDNYSKKTSNVKLIYFLETHTKMQLYLFLFLLKK